jgi:hypothetical protein
MLDRGRFAVTMVLAAMLLALGVQTAGAGRLASTNRMIRVVFRSLSFQSSGGIEVNCPVTLEGSFHSRTLSKVLNSLQGFISRAVVGAAGCASGTFSFLNGVENVSNTLPWHVTYGSFAGTLPNMTSIRLNVIGLAVRVRDSPLGFPIDCLFLSSAAAPAPGSLLREAGGTVTGWRSAFTDGAIAKHSEITPPCPSTINWGTTGEAGRVTVLGSTEAIDMTLI